MGILEYNKAGTTITAQILPGALHSLQLTPPVLYIFVFPQYPYFEQKYSQTPSVLTGIPPLSKLPPLQFLHLAGHESQK